MAPGVHIYKISWLMWAGSAMRGADILALCWGKEEGWGHGESGRQSWPLMGCLVV